MPIHARLGRSSLIRRSWFIEKLSRDEWWRGYQASPRILQLFQLPSRECDRLRMTIRAHPVSLRPIQQLSSSLLLSVYASEKYGNFLPKILSRNIFGTKCDRITLKGKIGKQTTKIVSQILATGDKTLVSICSYHFSKRAQKENLYRR